MIILWYYTLNQIKKKTSRRATYFNVRKFAYRANQNKSILCKQSHDVCKTQKNQHPSAYTAVNSGLAAPVSARDEDIAVYNNIHIRNTRIPRGTVTRVHKTFAAVVRYDIIIIIFSRWKHAARVQYVYQFRFYSSTSRYSRCRKPYAIHKFAYCMCVHNIIRVCMYVREDAR